ncbi:MAG TPA: DUF4405 domain-containing protein [Acidobacteriota bacterium]|nr:DUF4405 domain-containing protein [Acidobacteriota bacterium]
MRRGDDGSCQRKFNLRAFVSLILGFCGIGLSVTGLVDLFTELSPEEVTVHALHACHNVLALLFIVFFVWHIVLNWRPLRNYLGKTSRLPSVSRELILASAIVVGLLVASVVSQFYAHGQ